MTGLVAGHEEAQLLEHIAMLTNLLDQGGFDYDIPAINAALGETWLQIYAQRPDEQALTTGVAYLSEAAETAPRHDQRLRWWCWLGIGYGDLGRLRQSDADYAIAIRWTSKIIEELPPGDEDRDSVVAGWMELKWERFWLLRCTEGTGWDETRARRETDGLLASLRCYEVGDRDPEAGHLAQVLLGLGLLTRHGLLKERPDLDAGIVTLAAAIPCLAPGDNRLPFACALLSKAYDARYDLDGDRADLDLAILTGQTGVEAIDAAAPSWRLLHLGLAYTHKSRWMLDHDRADLDRSIECWQILLAGDPDHHSAAQCGNLLRERSELSNDPDDIAAAITLLELAARTPPDHDDLWQPWYDLGRAYQRQAELLTRPDRLDDATGSFSRALELGAPTDDVLFLLHSSRLRAACDALDAASPQAPDAAGQLRQMIAEAVTAFESPHSASGEMQALLAGGLARGLMQAAWHEGDWLDSARVMRLTDLARQLPDAPPEWLAAMDVATGIAQYAADITEAQGTGEAGVATLADVLRRPHLDDTRRAELTGLVALIMQGRTNRGSDLRGQHTAIEMIGNAANASPTADPELAITSMILYALECGRRQDFDEFATVLRQIEERLAAIEPSVLFQRTTGPQLNLLRQLGALLAGNTAMPADALPALPDLDPGLNLLTTMLESSARLSQAIARQDIAALREYGEYLKGLAALAAPGSTIRLGICLIAGHGWLAAARLDPADVAFAQQAAHWYQEAINAVSGPHDNLWSTLTLGLGESLRLIPGADLARTRDLGRSALYGHQLRVLLQSGTDYAMEAASEATHDAAVVAGWCLADGASGELLSVLDAGRGLVLQAATASRNIAQLLADNGHQELAAEWQATSGLGRDRLTGTALGEPGGGTEFSDDLRSRVVRALDSAAVDAVSTADVQRALAAFGADALVYLVPTTADMPATALIVPVSGAVDPVPMPGLDVGQGAPIHRWIDVASAARDIEPASAPSASDLPGVSVALDDMCRWAWQACAGRLVEYARRWNLNRPARLVLVPMGTLGLVPWHAAFTTEQGRRRYAIDELVLSYTVSARTLCMTAHHPIRPIESALVVGDPQGNLAFAGLEAGAVHASFYPRGTYLGRSDDLASEATPGRVLDWIASARGPSLLHLACHGGMDTRHPADAHLVLAGGSKLAARTLVEASRVAALSIDQVFLAACTTNAIGADHDEVFSLATAFLAAGAHTVFGSLWPVPDTETSLLMYMVHHYLNAEGCLPMDALHRAQHWMLDPQRKPPVTMPSLLASHCAGEAPARPVAWAAFTHGGR